MNGSSSTSPLSSLSQSNGTFSSGDLNDESSFPSSSLSSSGSGQSLTGLFEQIGPLLGLFMNGSSSTSPLSSLSQSNETFGRSLMDFASVNTTGFEGTPSADGNSSSLLDETFTFQNESLSSMEEEKAKVQEELVNSLKKTFSIGAEIPELPSFFDRDNATVFIKVNVVNPIDKKANASDFPLQINIQYEGTLGLSSSSTNANDAGVFIKLPPGAYGIIAPLSETGDQSKDSFLNSFSTSYSKGCSGQISYMETKDCIITKKYTNTTNNDNTGIGN
jgi:hypothetical protein